MALSDQSEPDASDLKLMLYRNNLKQALLSARGLMKPNIALDSSKVDQVECKVQSVVEQYTNQSKLSDDVAADQKDKTSLPRQENELNEGEGDVHVGKKQRTQRTAVARNLVFEAGSIDAHDDEEGKNSAVDSRQTKTLESSPNHIVKGFLDKYQKNDRHLACLHCCKTFRSRMSLKMHMDAHSRDTFARNGSCFPLLDKSFGKKKLFPSTGNPKMLKCNFCKKIFTTRSLLSRHKAAQHRKDHLLKKEFTCKKCGKVFTTQHRFSVHLMEHGLKFKCGMCDMRFKHPKELFYHKSIHVNDVIQCNICKEIFDSKLKLAKHLEVHNEKKSKLICKFCKKTFKLPKDLAQHQVTCSLQECFDCASCGENFASKSELATHLEHHLQNKDGKEEFKCEICKRTFKFIKHFDRHKKWSNCQNVTTEKELARDDSSSNPCALVNSDCKEPVHNDDGEYKHEDIYVTEKLIDCELDEILTPLKANLEENVKLEDNGGAVEFHTHREETNCDGSETADDPSDVLCCRVCDEIFVSQEHFRKHQEEHNNLEYQCTECSAVFSSDARRYKHLYQAHYTII